MAGDDSLLLAVCPVWSMEPSSMTVSRIEALCDHPIRVTAPHAGCLVLWS